jgi:hypothetical protein
LGAIALPDFVSLLPGVWVGALAVGTVLFLHGYYLTTALFGVVWRSQRSWVYPAMAAILFVIHTHIAFVRGKPDTSAEFQAAEIPFLVGGACIVFACASAGNWCLRKWGGWGAPTPGDAPSPDGVSLTGG